MLACGWVGPFAEPILSLTSDVDWASEACIADLAAVAAAHGVVPTFFATHRSPVLDALLDEGRAEVGIHPNFLPGSTHGRTVDEVLDHVLGLYPQAGVSRSHAFVDSTPIARALVARGVRHDSNLCLYRQAHLVPLQHASGLQRYPVFWEDDCHWHLGDDWDPDRLWEDLCTPGLKILNVHPFPFALNIGDADGYERHKPHAATIDEAGITSRRTRGPGTRALVEALLTRAQRAGLRFHTMSEICAMSTEQEGTTA